MTKNLIPVLIFIWAAISNLHAQGLGHVDGAAGANLSTQDILLQAPPGYNYIYNEDNVPRGTEGSPYLEEDWKASKIFLESGKKISGLMIKYNVQRNQIFRQNFHL
jgi:hypothetical protein